MLKIRQLAQYWRNGFKWRKVEAQLNELPQSIAKVTVKNFGVYDVHFIHQLSSVSNAIPLLFIHGWPGSFIEVTKILTELANPENDGPSFHIIAPSLIDFGFSSGSKKVLSTYLQLL